MCDRVFIYFLFIYLYTYLDGPVSAFVFTRYGSASQALNMGVKRCEGAPQTSARPQLPLSTCRTSLGWGGAGKSQMMSGVFAFVRLMTLHRGHGGVAHCHAPQRTSLTYPDEHTGLVTEPALSGPSNLFLMSPGNSLGGSKQQPSGRGSRRS
jgi:hypothetical protein